MGPDKELEASFERIRKRFITRLQDSLPAYLELEKQIDRGTLTNIDDICRQMHNLAGSAQIFGFADLSDHAAKVEEALDQILAGSPVEEIQAPLKSALWVFLEKVMQIISLQDGKAIPAPNIDNSEKKTQDYDYQILVADDDEMVMDLLKEGFSKEKCHIIQAINGKAVLEILTRMKQQVPPAKPDLILLDVNMPVMNGFEALKAIKQDPALDAIPVMMLTRRDEDENIIEGIGSGASDYITKPFELKELVSRVLGILQRNNTKVLIADDDTLICDLLQQRFKRMGYTVLTAINGNEALRRVHQDQPDVAVLDVMMPGMDGLAVLRQIKYDPGTTDIPIVFLTAKRQPENILKGLETGAHDYITKPFDVDEVAARVSGILQRRKSA